MQLKKPGEDIPAQDNSPKIAIPPAKEDVVNKKIVSLGMLAGAVLAIGASYWFLSKDSNKKIEKLESFLHQEKMEAKSELKPLIEPSKDAPPASNMAQTAPAPVVSAPPPEVAVATPVQPQVDVNQATAPFVESNPKVKDIVYPPSQVRKTKLRSVVNSTPEISKNNLESYEYNALEAGPIIHTKRNAHVQVSRSPTFKSIYLQGKADKVGEFLISNPPPGKIYWRIKHQRTVHAITINPPESTNLIADIPTQIVLGDSFSWSSKANVSYYKIEVSVDENFTGPVKTFSTINKAMNTSQIGVGSWYIRVAAMNLQSGTFEFSPIFPLNVRYEGMGIINPTPQKLEPTPQPQKIIAPVEQKTPAVREQKVEKQREEKPKIDSPKIDSFPISQPLN